MRKLVRRIFFSGLLILVFFLLLEGIGNVVYFGIRFVEDPPHLGGPNIRHDEQLGWTNIPGQYVEDMFGQGVYVKINEQGFRNNQLRFTEGVPPGQIRLICSGDSFTYGYGVSNDHTWCELLRREDDRLETVNMGKTGYGFDQAYLWYKRDGTALDHHVQIFAYITEDLARMETSQFDGFPKPLLELRDGELAVTNVPVPGLHRRLWWELRNRLLDPDQGLRTLHLLSRLIRTYLPGERPAAARPRSREIAGLVLADLKALNEQKGSVLVLVHLPTLGDWKEGPRTRFWRRALREEAERLSIPFVDLVAKARRFEPGEFRALFSRSQHYTVLGNRFVAERLYAALTREPALAGILAKSGRDHSLE